MKTLVSFLILTIFFYGCSAVIPSAGPSTQEIKNAPEELLTVIEVSPRIVGSMRLSNSDYKLLLKEFQTEKYSPRIGAGDLLEVVIYETPPPVLFTSQSPLAQGVVAFNVPAQIVDDEGYIKVPFVGRVYVKDRTPEQVANEIEKALRGRANRPQAVVHIKSFFSSTVTLMGHVKENRLVPLTYSVSTLLDVLGALGGPTSPIHKTVVKVSRNSKEIAIPLEELLRNPELNINLRPGDVITVIFQNQSATILGATGKNVELDFEVTGITLSQALARAGGLRDDIAHAKGLFVFRFEDKDFLEKLSIPYKAYTKDGKVPVVYNIDLTRGENVLLLREFPVKDKDIIYVSTAPTVQIKKFLSTISDIIQPIFMIRALTR
ncbi:polysaccharide biosynthesis/export family protein [Thermocrinis sp.]